MVMLCSAIDEKVMLSSARNEKITKDTWLGDTGATGHMRYSLDGMSDLEDIDLSITLGDGKSLSGKMKGIWKGTIIERAGEKQDITLRNVFYVPICSV